MRVPTSIAAVLAALALGAVAASAQGASWRLVQAGDGSLHVIADGVRHAIAPAPIAEAELGAIPPGEPWNANFAAASPPSQSDAAVVATPAAVTAEVVFTHVEAEDRTLRFVAAIRNPFNRTVEGFTTRWEALDASGAIVGTFTTRHTPIPAGATLLYVGGGGGVNLSGATAAVQLFIVDQGRQSEAATRFFTVGPAELSQEGTSTRPREREYRAAANVTTTAETVQRSDVVVSAILRDVGGNIVGADFDTAPETVPDTLPPGSRFRAELRFIETTAAAASAEVIAYAR